MLLAADGGTRREELDRRVAGLYKQMLETRYVGGRLLMTELVAGSDPTDTEETLARIVGAAVGLALKELHSREEAIEAAYEGVLTALRFADYADLIISTEREFGA